MTNYDEIVNAARTVDNSITKAVARIWVDRRPVKQEALDNYWVRRPMLEAAEAMDAYEGWTGDNPRKGYYSSQTELRKELLDTAVSALAAYRYFSGSNDLVADLAAHCEHLDNRQV